MSAVSAKRTPSPKPKAGAPRCLSERDRQLAELLELSVAKLAELYGRTRVRGGEGAHNFVDATDIARDLLHRRARALGMDSLCETVAPEKLRPPLGSASERGRMSVETARRAAGRNVADDLRAQFVGRGMWPAPAACPVPPAAPRTPQEIVELTRRRAGTR